MEAETLVKIETIPGRGRAVVSSQPLKAGQIILKESPILLYSALPINNNHQQQQSSTLYCDYCFGRLQSPALSCPSCSNHHFCNPNCLSVAAASSHSSWVCQALARLRDCTPLVQLQPQERQVQARFLVAAYNLALVSPCDFQILLSLQGYDGVGDEDAAVAQFLHSLISSVCPPPPIEGFSLSLELTTALLAKDKVNAFGLMESFDSILKNGGERSVRAYGIYSKASLFNHDCLPNACRFDYLDTARDHNTDIVVRMIHDVPQGREICLSYFPVNLNYPARQNRLLEDYGFVCECDRCRVEANWSDHEEVGEGDFIDDDDDDDDDDENEVMEEDQDASMEAAVDNINNEADFPHAYFFARYMCNQENCCGTLAPLPPSDANPSTLLECNVCGSIKNDEVVDGDGGLDMDD